MRVVTQLEHLEPIVNEVSFAYPLNEVYNLGQCLVEVTHIVRYRTHTEDSRAVLILSGHFRYGNVKPAPDAVLDALDHAALALERIVARDVQFYLEDADS